MRVGVEVDLLVVLVAAALERLLVDAGPGHGAAEGAEDRGALRAAEVRVAAGDDVGGDAALPVGRTGERHQAVLAGQAVLLLDRVADGEDVRVAGALLVVHADAAARAHLDAGHLRQRRLRLHADAEDDDVGGVDLVRPDDDLERPVVRLPERRRARAEHHLHAVLAEMALQVARHLRVERRP